MSGSRGTRATAVVMALSTWSCGSTAPEAAPNVAAIVVSPSSSTIALNAQLPLQAQVQDESGATVPDAAITWTVQDPRIVSISETGVVRALAVGTSQVAANALGKSGLATITVNPVTASPGPGNPGAVGPGPVASVIVTTSSKKVKEGSTVQLTAVAVDSKGIPVPHQSFTWSSSNTKTATVSSSGVVTGKKSGEVTISAETSANGGKRGSVEIEVKK